jgi:branched-chain amino acid transport system ATP-binding protein
MVREIAWIIRAINREGKSIILVKQNAAMALRLAPKGYVMQTGSVVLEGKGQDLLNDGAGKRTYLGGSAAAGGCR